MDEFALSELDGALAPIGWLSLRGLSDAARAAAGELSRLQPALDVAYIDDAYPFMLSHERERFIDAPRGGFVE